MLEGEIAETAARQNRWGRIEVAINSHVSPFSLFLSACSLSCDCLTSFIRYRHRPHTAYAIRLTASAHFPQYLLLAGCHVITLNL